MEKYMEGEWNRFTFKRITPADYPQILQHLQATFYKEETGCKLLGIDESDFEAFDAFVLKCLNLNDDISFYAEDRATGKVAGVRITYKCTKELENESGKKPPTDKEPGKLAKYGGFVKQLKQKCNTFERYGVDYFADFLMQSVDPEFRKMGLATEMYRRSLGLLKERGYPLCQSLFSSPYTRKAVANLGFEEMGRLYFKEYKDEKGVHVFANAEPDMYSAGMAYRLI